MTILKDVFANLSKKFSENSNLIDELWSEIETNYSIKKRHYHTLAHIENLLLQLNEIKYEINDWDTILFTLFYHDVVYNALKNDNEDRSADFARMRLKKLSVPELQIENCANQIIATKKHLLSLDNDTNYFLDADLSILGADWKTYLTYAQQVRREYAIYPDLIYKPGRKKVLQHFLQMDRIFKTEHLFQKFEMQAKLNLQHELTILNKAFLKKIE